MTRRAAQMLVDAPVVRFDLSDLHPPAFGATAGQGMWEIFQDFLEHPGDAVGIAQPPRSGGIGRAALRAGPRRAVLSAMPSVAFVARAAYVERPAPAGAQPWVACTWEVRVGAEPIVNPILPDGCTDVVRTSDGTWLLVGPMTRVDEATMPPGAVSRGVRFRPGALPALMRDVSPSEILDGGIVLDRPPSLQALLRDAAPPDPLVQAAVAALQRRDAPRVEALARDLAVSERQLRRRFTAAVGYAPKRFARIARMQRLLAAAQTPRTPSWAWLAADHGYADEAHMVRDVTALAGRSPAQLVRNLQD